MYEIEKEMMLSMISILNDANKAYYSGRPFMSDKEFDARLKDLQELEKMVGITYSNSPTVNVGAKILTELNEVSHSVPMLSLEKCHSVEELIKFANDKELVTSIKLDGLTCRLTYENGTLIRGETRGNGYVGNDVTEHIKRFKNIPLKIDKKCTYVIDGECIIINDDFMEVNKNDEFKNSRNLAAGTLSVLDTSLVAKRKLSFYAWDVIEGGSNNKLKDNLNEARELGFDVVPSWIATNLRPKNLQSNIDYVFDYASENGYPNDGIVFKFNDIEYGKSLGQTSHHFKNGIAYKRKDDTYRTILKDIEWSCGKTGILTPVAIFEAVEIGGSVVEKASLSNITIMEQTLGKPYVGQKIYVSKRNMVIPKVEYGERFYE